LKKPVILLVIFLSFALSGNLKAQDLDFNTLFQKFLKYYSSGDLLNAQKSLISALESDTKLNNGELIAVYNNLGVTSLALGNYAKALEYNTKAEELVSVEGNNSQELADIYNNKGHIFNIRKSYDLAIEYLEKSIRIYLNLDNRNKNVLNNLTSAYINISIAYIDTKNYSSALRYLEKSADIKLKYKLSGLAFNYLNIAKIYVKTYNSIKAEEYFLKSITSFKTEFGPNYYRTTSVLFDYGLFLRSVGRYKEALAAHRNALTICLKNYGEKHTLVSLSYKLIGDHYQYQNSYDSALCYYQKSLIAVVKDFNDPYIFSNPSIDSALFDIRLLDNLKSKARVLELLSGEQNDPGMKLKTIGKSLETIELALRLIDNIRNNYLSEESRIYLAENEKETYIFAVHIAARFYSLSDDNSMDYKIYTIAQKAKAAILRNEIAGNELLYSAGMPDSLRVTQNKLTADIASYNNLILEESRRTNPDSNKISLWKDALFDMTREKKKVADEIVKVFPQYYDLIRKTEPVSVSTIQKNLKRDETLIDYLLSNQYSGGKRKLYTFIISSNRIEFCETGLDSLFIKNAEILQNTSRPAMTGGLQKDNFTDYTGALNYMYLNLIEPFEGLFSGSRLIIIPDEEIGWLPFDAFLKSNPGPDQSDYEGLPYLIHDYTFSYGYSSSLIFSTGSRFKKAPEVFSFSPYYGNTALPGKVPDSLYGAVNEIESVYKWFRGKKFTGDKATKANFILAMHHTAIFHLAMHSMSDSSDSRYSFMLFDPPGGSPEAGKLYNYEISLSRLKSPMVVLSSCNSGTGTLYYGEGLMSLARSFILAGASSVIKTAWEVNDEASSAVITRFYYHLSKGKQKNEALRLAKLEYLKGSSPVFTNPYFWAGYEVLGDNAPVARNYLYTVLTVIILIVILTGGRLLIYFKRRRISSDRSL
jgi:CHAT domain-containing protein/tetratricopeptide (TPR) repeat protein